MEKYGGQQRKIGGSQLKSKVYSYKTFREFPVKENQIKERVALFKQIDENANGLLTLQEIKDGMEDALPYKFMDKWEKGWRDSIISAFDIATQNARKNFLVNSEYLQVHQFRRLLLALQQQFDYYFVYTKIDRNDDASLSFEEFKKAKNTIEKWQGKMSDLKKAFYEIDKD